MARIFNSPRIINCHLPKNFINCDQSYGKLSLQLCLCWLWLRRAESEVKHEKHDKITFPGKWDIWMIKMMTYDWWLASHAQSFDRSTSFTLEIAKHLLYTSTFIINSFECLNLLESPQRRWRKNMKWLIFAFSLILFICRILTSLQHHPSLLPTLFISLWWLSVESN